MAISGLTTWEIRGGAGNDNNGGAFVEGASGVDYSQQDSAQATGTNLTVDATTNTDVTPDGHSAHANDIGNVIQITTSGGGWTAGFYQIMSIQGGTKWRLDRSPAATSTAGASWSLGGALNTIGKAAGGSVAKNTFYVKATADYVITSTISFPGNGWRVIGYDSSRTEYLTAATIGTRPVIRSSTDNVHLFTCGSSPITGVMVYNLIFRHQAASSANRGRGIDAASVSLYNFTAMRCLFDGCRQPIFCSVPVKFTFVDCEITDTLAPALTVVNNDDRPWVFIRCNFHDLVGTAIGMASGGSITLHVIGCQFTDLGADAIVYTSSGTTASGMLSLVGNTFANIAGSAISWAPSGGDSDICIAFSQNLIWNCDEYGIEYINGRTPNYSGGWNAIGDCTLGARYQLPALPGDVTLTVDPFTDSGAGDFTLNNTSGGGASCRQAGPATVPA